MGQAESNDSKGAGRPPENSGTLGLETVYVPLATQYQMSDGMAVIYQMGQEYTRAVIHAQGVENGISALLSGVTRELRRHVTAEAAEGILRGLADSMAEAAKNDLPGPEG
jgi:hypothetical protein